VRVFYSVVFAFLDKLSFLLSGCFVKQRTPWKVKFWLIPDSLRLFAGVTYLQLSGLVSQQWQICKYALLCEVARGPSGYLSCEYPPEDL